MACVQAQPREASKIICASSITATSIGLLVPTISIVLRDHARAVGRHVLLAGQQRAGHAARHQAVAPFERQQAQRREVGAVERLRQALEGGVRLAAVGRADVERDAALQLARLLEGVGVALEGEFAVQAFERVELGDAVFPAVLRARAGGLQLGQRLRRARTRTAGAAAAIRGGAACTRGCARAALPGAPSARRRAGSCGGGPSAASSAAASPLR